MVAKCHYKSPIGELTLLVAGDEILMCEFTDKSERISSHINRYYRDRTLRVIACPASVKSGLDNYFTKGEALNGFTLSPAGTPFQKHIWKWLASIPFSSTWSYKLLAEQAASHPRAVGSANGSNPICLFIPCHRVIGADGTLKGYAGGIDRKNWLLNHEDDSNDY